jgi:hypothetical protein
MFWSDWGPVAGFCEHGNEPCGFMKGVTFLNWLRECERVTKGSVLSSEFTFFFERKTYDGIIFT